MIDNKDKLKDCLRIEEDLCLKNGYKGCLHAFVTGCEIGKIAKFLRVLRLDEYYSNVLSKNPIFKFKRVYYRRKHNKIGCNLGISIPINTFGKGLMIYHSQGIIVHRDVRCGNFCKLHGLNCIGNNGKESDVRNTPILGDGIDIGVSAIIIGAIELADDIRIAAGAVVCKSCINKSVTLAGVPAKKM